MRKTLLAGVATATLLALSWQYLPSVAEAG